MWYRSCVFILNPYISLRGGPSESRITSTYQSLAEKDTEQLAIVTEEKSVSIVNG